jgi:iron complex transport system ATP-binding protein
VKENYLKTMTQKALIDLTDVSLQRGGVPILSHIDWKTHTGEHWFLMGNNGSGKTTLMEIIMGYLWPQKGRVAIMGQPFGDVYLQELRAAIGYVSPWVFHHTRSYIPVKHVIASGMDASVGYFDRFTPQIEARVRELLCFFHCEDLGNRTFGTLSSGQQLKVMISRSLMNDPVLMLLDEPFSLLDVGSRFQMYRYIEKICRLEKGPQVILATHHFDDLIPVFTHGLLLKRGSIYGKGRREAVLRREMISGAFDIPKEQVQDLTP